MHHPSRKQIHIDNCVYRSVKCPWCQRDILISSLYAHSIGGNCDIATYTKIEYNSSLVLSEIKSPIVMECGAFKGIFIYIRPTNNTGRVLNFIINAIQSHGTKKQLKSIRISWRLIKSPDMSVSVKCFADLLITTPNMLITQDIPDPCVVYN